MSTESSEIFVYNGIMADVELEIFKVFGAAGVNYKGFVDENGVASEPGFKILKKRLNCSDLFSETFKYDGRFGEMCFEMKKTVGHPGIGYEGEIDEYGNGFGIDIRVI